MTQHSSTATDRPDGAAADTKDVAAVDTAAGGSAGARHLSVLVTGSTGLVGEALVARLSAAGHRVTRLVRRTPRSGGAGTAQVPEIRWDPQGEALDPHTLDGIEAVVHLAGENVAAGRWTQERKVRIRGSRVDGTRVLAEALAAMDSPPRVLVSASAIGFYGDRGDAVVDEEAEQGRGFLAEVCNAWEQATRPAEAAGVRVARLRFGVVLSRDGGALAKMLLPFRLGVGGVMGSGDQVMSWVSIDDVLGAIEHALTCEALRGPVNVVAPSPSTNREFTKALGRALGRPTIFPMPAFAARLAFGEMADEMLLASTRVAPTRLLESGYTFRHPDIDVALRDVLQRA